MESNDRERRRASDIEACGANNGVELNMPAA
jgi:hypothetical protein